MMQYQRYEWSDVNSGGILHQSDRVWTWYWCGKRMKSVACLKGVAPWIGSMIVLSFVTTAVFDRSAWGSGLTNDSTPKKSPWLTVYSNFPSSAKDSLVACMLAPLFMYWKRAFFEEYSCTSPLSKYQYFNPTISCCAYMMRSVLQISTDAKDEILSSNLEW